MARKQFLINRHTPNKTGFPSDLKLGEIAVRHNEEAPELIINLVEDGDETDFRTFIDKVAIEKLFETFNTNLSGEIDSLSGVVEAHIEAVETKFKDYYTSAQTDSAIAAAKDAAIGAASAYTDGEVTKVQTALTETINGVDAKVTALTKTVADNKTAVETKFKDYYTSAQTDSKIAEAKAEAIGAASAYTDGEVTKVQTALTESINDVDAKVTALTQTVANNQTAVDNKFKDYYTSAQTDSAIAAAKDAAIEAASAYTNSEVNKVQTALTESINDVNSKVDTLVGDDSGKTARSIAVEEVAKVVANAPEKFDTLKEIADWIGTASGVSAATLVADIENLKKADEELSKSIQAVDSKVDKLATSAMTEIGKRALSADVNTLVENTSAATYNKAYGDASAYTDTQVTAAKNTLTESINGIASRVESLESLSAATQSAIQTIEVSGVDGVKVTKSGTTRTIDFSEMTIDCGEF